MKKIQRHITGFLFATPCYLFGAATVTNLKGNFYEYNASNSVVEADFVAINNDFNMAGEDIGYALENARKELLDDVLLN